MTLYIDSILISLIAYVYAEILTGEGMLLSGVYVFLRDRLKLPKWLFMPLIGCAYCVAGQMGLWYYLIVYFKQYDLIDHILFASIAIFGIELIVSILNKLNK